MSNIINYKKQHILETIFLSKIGMWKQHVVEWPSVLLWFKETWMLKTPVFRLIKPKTTRRRARGPGKRLWFATTWNVPQEQVCAASRVFSSVLSPFSSHHLTSLLLYFFHFFSSVFIEFLENRHIILIQKSPSPLKFKNSFYQDSLTHKTPIVENIEFKINS